MKTITSPFVFLCFACIACNYIPCSSSSDLKNVSGFPPRETISGMYRPDVFTGQDFQDYIMDSTMLILTDDGKIMLKNFRIEAFGSWEKHKTGIVNGSGSWKLEAGSGTTNINTNITFDQPGVMRPVPFRLFKKHNKYYILIDFGDPDACSSLRMEQQRTIISPLAH